MCNMFTMYVYVQYVYNVGLVKHENGIPSTVQYLNAFCECVEHLTAHLNGFEEVFLPSFVDHLLAGIVPIEVHHRLLQTQ